MQEEASNDCQQSKVPAQTILCDALLREDSNQEKMRISPEQTGTIMHDILRFKLH